MKNRNNNLISFGITLASSSRTEAANTDLEKRVLKVRRRNALPGKAKQVSTHDFNLPPPKPFTPDMFNSEPRPLPAFPPPVKMSPKVERVRKELELSRSRKASQSASGESSMAWAVAGEFFKVVFAGVFLAFKYIFIAAALIITISCMICAGRQTGGLR